MKKSIRNMLIGLVIVLSLTVCSDKSNVEAKSLYEQGLEIVQLMSEMTQTEGYVDIYTGNSEVKTIIQAIGADDYSSPKAVYAISAADDDLAAMVGLNELDNISQELDSVYTSQTWMAAQIAIQRTCTAAIKASEVLA